jgi:hypothetical protein
MTTVLVHSADHDLDTFAVMVDLAALSGPYVPPGRRPVRVRRAGRQGPRFLNFVNAARVYEAEPR